MCRCLWNSTVIWGLGLFDPNLPTGFSYLSHFFCSCVLLRESVQERRGLSTSREEHLFQRERNHMEQPLEASVEAARAGSMTALEAVITSIQDRIYGIAMRMLAHPQDAQDATHEILVKIVTNLNTF